MSTLRIWLIWSLLGSILAQNDISNQTLNQAQNITHKIPHNDTVETATRDPEHEHQLHLHSSNENSEETPPPPPSPLLKFNPPDFFPFPKLDRVRQFWRDHPDLKAIPDLPTRDTEYPQWLLAVMGGFHPPTDASIPAKKDQVFLSKNKKPLQQPEVQPLDSRSLDFESEAFNPEILPKQNNMEGRFESNNVPVQTETGNRKFILPPEISIQQPLLNSRIHQLRRIPDNIQRPSEETVNPDFSQNQKEPIVFRIPLNVGFGRIQHIRNSNTETNPKNFVIVRDNRFQSQQSETAPVQMLPLHRQDFRGIPVTISRPSILHQPGILMLPVRNQNEQSQFNHQNFIQSHSPRMSPVQERFLPALNQNRPKNPSFSRQNAIPVDPPFSSESWPRVLEQDENLERMPTVMNQRRSRVIPEKRANMEQNTMIQSNGSSTFPNPPRIGVRKKRQASFDSFDPFGMGNLFSLFPSEKEEPRNAFNWFPQDPIMSSPTHQSPISSGIFIPNSNRRPTSRPKQQITFPQDNWMIMPSSSSNAVPSFRAQNPQPNQRLSKSQLPKDFMIIQPRKSSRTKSNQMPWMLSNLFGGDLFPENNDNQMWTFQKPFNPNTGTNKNQPRNNRQSFSNNFPTRPSHEERVPSRNNQQFIVQPPRENFHPSRGQTHRNNIQPPPKNLPPLRNRNNINQGNIQASTNMNQIKTHIQPQQNWRPAPQIPVQSRPQLPVAPQGTWIPRKNTLKETPVSRTNHFHEVPSPHHHQPRPTEQSPRSAQGPKNHENRHQSHRTAILPEIQKGKRKLSPSEVRHLLSLLPEFPKDIYKKPIQNKPTGPSVSITVNSTGIRQKRTIHGSFLKSEDIPDGNFTRNYPGPNRMHRSEFPNTKHLNSTELPVSDRNRQWPKDRRKRDIEESLIRDVVFGSYGYHSEHNYPDGSFSDFSSPFLGFTASNNHDSGLHHLWGNMFPGRRHNLFNSVWDWPHHDYHMPHLGTGNFLFGHTNGHLHPSYPPSHSWHGNTHPLNHGRLPGSRGRVVIPLAVPRANPNQLSYTARFRYRFGIYPGYSDYVPGIDDHKIFFFYDPNQRNRRPDAVIPFRSY